MRTPPPAVPAPQPAPAVRRSGEPEAALPAAIGPYAVVREVARGGMATVYEVRDPATRGPLALKLLQHRGLALARFHREFDVLSRIDHPGIVRVYRFGVAEHHGPYLTMELVDGVPAQVWAKALGRPGAPERTRGVIRVCSALLDALGCIHDRGLVHRDLKSSNVLVLPDGRIKLLDFGTVRLGEGGHEALSAGGEFVGTYAYASPEQLRGEPVDLKADLYALGVLLYRLLTGRRPFEGDNPHILAQQHIEQAPRPPSALVADLPPELDAVVLALLEKEKEARPSSAVEVVRRLAPLALDAVAWVEPPVDEGWAVVGRGTLLAVLQDAVVRAEPGAAWVVQGPAGAGAGAVLDALGRALRAQGLRVVDEVLGPDEGLLALVRLARGLLRGMPTIDVGLGAALASLSRPPPEGAVDTRPGAVADLLLAAVVAHRGPLVVMLREVGRADPLVDQAIGALRRRARRRRLPLCIVGCDEGEGGAWPATCASLADAQLHPLPPMDVRDVGRLVSVLLDRQAVPAALVARLARESGGRPAFVVALVHAMRNAGSLARVGGATPGAPMRWRDLSGGIIPMPAPIAQALARRVELLDPTARRVAEALSVARGPLSARALAAAGVVEGTRVIDACAALLLVGLCVGDPQGAGIEIAVGAWATALREAIRPTRLPQLRAQLAMAVGEAPPTAEKVLLCLLAGRTDEAARVAVRWAAPRVAAGEGAMVLRTLDAARAAEGGSSTALVRLCGEARGQADPRDPEALRLLRAAAQAPDALERAAADLGLARLHRRRGERGAAAVHRARAEEEASQRGDLGLLLRVVIETAEAAIDEVQLDAAFDALDRAAELAQLLEDAVAGAEVLGLMGALRAELGALREGEADLRRAVGQAREAGAPALEVRLRMAWARALRLLGRTAEAEGELGAALEADAARPGALRSALLVEQAHQHIDLDQLAEAREALASRAVDEPLGVDPTDQAGAALAVARLALASGGGADAVPALTDALRAAEECGLVLAAHRLRLARAEALAATGAVAEADRDTRVACRELERLGLWPALAVACIARARAMRGVEAPARALAPAWGWLVASEARLPLFEAHVLLAEYAAARGDHELLRGELAQASCVLDELRALQLHAGDPTLQAHPLARRLSRLHGALQAPAQSASRGPTHPARNR